MKLSFLSVPYDMGRYDAGAGKGPGHLLAAGLVSRLRSLGHSASERTLLCPEPEKLTDTQAVFRLNAILSRAVAETLREGSLPIILAGNCITAAGTLSGIHDPQTGALWLDAHGDFNTPETTQSGYLDGMALAVACGSCWKSLSAADPLFQPVAEERVVLLGARDLDHAEAEALQASRIALVSAAQLRKDRCAIPELRARRLRGLYVHLDADVLDAGVGQANRFASTGGLLARELQDTLSWAAKHFDLKALAVTAYSPAHDRSGTVREAILQALLAMLRSGTAD